MAELFTMDEQHEICYAIGTWYCTFKRESDFHGNIELYRTVLINLIGEKVNLDDDRVKSLSNTFSVWYLISKASLPEWFGYHKEKLKEMICELHIDP